jgi:hypothetical protein
MSKQIALPLNDVKSRRQERLTRYKIEYFPQNRNRSETVLAIPCFRLRLRLHKSERILLHTTYSPYQEHEMANTSTYWDISLGHTALRGRVLCKTGPWWVNSVECSIQAAEYYEL